MKRFYYINHDEKEYITPCQKSTASFPHKEKILDCKKRFDANTHQQFQSTKTVFTDENNKAHELSDCHEKIEPLEYTTVKRLTSISLTRNSMSRYEIFPGSKLSGKELSPHFGPVTFQLSGTIDFIGKHDGSIWKSWRRYYIQIFSRLIKNDQPQPWQSMRSYTSEHENKVAHQALEASVTATLGSNDSIEFAARYIGYKSGKRAFIDKQTHTWSVSFDLEASWD